MKSVDLELALKDLGRSGTKVAQSLRDFGIKGQPLLPCKCPIANYLQALTGQEMSVYATSAYYKNNGFVFDGILLPKAVTIFIYKFDEGKFPDLVG